MDKNILSAREAVQKDIQHIADYWFNADADYLKNMGVDITKMPAKDYFIEILNIQFLLPYKDKKAYAVIWMVDGEAIGHSNLNPVDYGNDAYMHLHIWDKENRKNGYGVELIKLTLPYFFKNLNLKRIYCQPYALNPGPNKTLEKAGFKFVKEYITTPGTITFEQPVKLWEIDNSHG